MYSRAKELRSAPTLAQEIMWEWLRGNLTGVHFRRRAVVAGYIVDFYSGLVRIAVEIDGSMHDPVKARARDQHLKTAGVQTIRIPVRSVYQKFEILARDEWRRKRYLEHYKTRRYWRKNNKNLAVWELYDKLAAL